MNVDLTKTCYILLTAESTQSENHVNEMFEDVYDQLLRRLQDQWKKGTAESVHRAKPHVNEMFEDLYDQLPRRLQDQWKQMCGKCGRWSRITRNIILLKSMTTEGHVFKIRL